MVSLEEPCIYEGLTICVVNGDRKVSRKIDSNMTYPFYALDPESEYTVIVENAYGDILFSSEPVKVTSPESEYKVTGIASAANIEGIAFTEETDITNQVANTVSDSGSKTGHQWGEWKTISEATVFAEEVQNHICTVCGTEESRKNGNKLNPSMGVSADSIVLKIGQKTTRFAVSEMAKGDSVKSWKSSNTAIVKVSGKENGTCTITAKKKTGSAKITPGIANVKSSATIKKGKSITLKPKKYGTNSKLVYTSSNTKVAVVNKNGKITGKKKGTAYITVKAGSLSVKCKVTVK